MAKSKVLRNAKAHQVKVQAGSNVAQSKPAPKVGPREDVADKPSTQRGPTTPTTIRPVTRITPRPAKPRAPGSTTLRANLAKPTGAARRPPVPDTKQLWASDEGVLQRLNDLRQRNALLAEQLDRLEAANKT